MEALRTPLRTPRPGALPPDPGRGAVAPTLHPTRQGLPRPRHPRPEEPCSPGPQRQGLAPTPAPRLRPGNPPGGGAGP